MFKTFVLMTAMPPTLGHLQLIQFANRLAPRTEVIACTQPFEPFPEERVAALREAVAHDTRLAGVTVHHLNKTIEQNPKAPGFWDMWRTIMRDYGARKDDLIVASERYGQRLAEETGMRFYPYDIDRTLNGVKATPVRDDPAGHFNDILPEFQPFLRTTVTIFGAESTGKTTLSKALAAQYGATWLFEYTRPYLENTVNEITVDSMTAIWKGQTALQEQAEIFPRQLTIQDTDLYSTVGYWEFPQWNKTIGYCPEDLRRDANRLRSDLYIMTKSNIPFEPDPLRYGGDVREGSDEYWINVCEKYELPYVVLKSKTLKGRLAEAQRHIDRAMERKLSALSYDRRGL